MEQKKPLITFIVAYSLNRAIGKDNQLPWHISNDLKRFKKITLNHTVIMGRSTFLSLPAGPLPKRRNIVLSRSLNQSDGTAFEVANTIDQVFEKVKGEDEVFIIGGASVFEQFLPLADKLFLTIIEKDIEADTFFPEVDFSNWKRLSQETISDGPQNDFVYRYETWVRTQS